MRLAPALLLAFALGRSLFALEAPTLVERGPLPFGEPREGEVAPGTRDAWSLTVEANGVYELRVEQLGQNLVTSLELGGGTQRVADDRRAWSGVETIRFVAPRTGLASLRIALATSRPGRYRVEALALGAASDDDRRRDQAEALMAQGGGTDEPASWRAAALAFEALRLPEREVVALFKFAGAAASSAEPSLAAEALRGAGRCRTLAEQLDDDDARAECSYAEAGALWVAGRLSEAQQAYVDSAAVYERRGEYGPLAAVLHSLADLALAGGDLDRAQELSERVVPLFERDANHAWLAAGLDRLAAILASRGRYNEGLANFERAAEEFERSSERQALLGALQAQVNVGILYGQLGDPERSLGRLRAALARAAQLDDDAGRRSLVAFIHAAVAAEYEDLDEDDAAAAEYAQALELSKGTAGWRGVSAEAALNLGALEARRGRHAAAERLFERSLDQARAFGDQVRVARTQLEQARARVRAGRLDDAEAPLGLALETFARLRLVEHEARALTVRAELQRARGELQRALESAREALVRIESVRARVALLEQRAQYLGARRAVYDLAVGLLVELHRREPAAGHLARAFEMSERARARSLLDEDGREPAGPEPSPALASRRRAAFERIARLQKELLAQRVAEHPEAQALARLERELDEAVQEEQSAHRSLLQPGSGAALEPALTSADAARAALAPDELLLEYYVGREASWVFALDGGGLRVAALGPERGLRELVNALRAQLVKPSVFGAAPYATSARSAYRLLLAPLAARPEGLRRLRIVPDGPLWELPFEALTSAATGGTWADLAYVVKRFAVSYEPSASVATLRRDTRSADRSPLLVAFANPHVPAGDLSGSVAATVERATLGEGERWRLPPLACAEREARGVARLFGPGRARLFTGTEARESRAKRDADVARARYLLFATHGVVSERLPSQSGLVLSLSGDGGEDGLLQGYEIAELDLRARLVVLSACNSALGRNVRGEGLLGLARAFLQAGADALVASLWKVSDCSTSELVQALFRGLEAKAGPRPAAVALRDAKLGLLRGRTYAHPYYWAPFVLLGVEARESARQHSESDGAPGRFRVPTNVALRD